MLEHTKIMDRFAAYTNNYNAADPKIKLKIDHTYRVASFAEEIAKSLSLIPEQIEIAWLCGMLHDIGRFEQIRRYGTFSDALSIDHANFGADLLFKEGLYETYMPQNCGIGSYDGQKVRHLVEVAIRNHSKFRIDDGLNEEEILFSNILRDADKVDIFRVNCDTPLADIYNVSNEDLVSSFVSPATKSDALEGHCILRTNKSTAIDYLIGSISLVFELVYPKSLSLVKSQGYLDRLLAFPSENSDTLAFLSKLKNMIYAL